MESRTAVQYGRLELVNKVHEYFTSLDASMAADLGMAIRSYCNEQVDEAHYEPFHARIKAYLPRARDKKIRKLFNKLFPVAEPSIDLRLEAGTNETTKPTTIARQKILGLRLHDKHPHSVLTTRRD